MMADFINCLTVEEIKDKAKRIKELMERIPITDTKEIGRDYAYPHKTRTEHLRSIALR